ncbi:hypothetical protein N1851_024171 [Merluccius polli]|uniref:Uncharacterized protein n=1 Tax=Merluccius polli TaxID=89951 RepID=A0AA47MFM1_MERPO|nr:hypothetical protein N1851_024171 [Merluccius polli]
MHHSGIYTKVREVIDVDLRYNLIGGDYPRCSQCKPAQTFCPWSSEILKQLDPSNRNKFPAVLTTHLALDRTCVALLRPRTAGNSSSYLQQAFQEAHSEEWARRSCDYFTDCEIHRRSCLKQSQAFYPSPPAFYPLPLAQWFETVHANDVVGHLDELKGVITSTFGRILKLDSTKKVTKKLAGGIEDTATWMTNVGNEYLCQGIVQRSGVSTCKKQSPLVQRYRDAGEPQPDAIYVVRDCRVGAVLHWFRPWTSTVRLDVFHFMRRFTRGLTTEHHPLYGTFCSKLSSCIFEWDKQDVCRLKEAKRAELKKKHQGHEPTDAQVLASISSKELAKHCRRKTRGVEETRALIKSLLDSIWQLVDSTGLHLINQEHMSRVWEVQQKHLACIQDPPGVQLYTNIGSGLEKGDKTLDVPRCGRGSCSLESFHKNQCAFIAGMLKPHTHMVYFAIEWWRCNALHTQMYMLEGVSRWNLNRSAQALCMTETSGTKIYDIRLMSNVNALSNKVLGKPLLPEFIPPGKPTRERFAVEYLLTQSNRGDLLSQQIGGIGDFLPEILDEDLEDECPDVTVPQAHDLTLQVILCQQSPIEERDASPSPVHSPIEESDARPVLTPFEESGLVTPSPDTKCDGRGVAGWEAVDALAGYLVGLNRTITALSNAEVAEILRPPPDTPSRAKKTLCPDLGELHESAVALLQASKQPRVTMATGKRRATYFNNIELETLMHAYGEYLHVFRKKSNTAAAAKERETAWEKIASRVNAKKADSRKTGGGPAPPPLTVAEELALSHNTGRPVAEGIPGGSSSSECTPQDTMASGLHSQNRPKDNKGKTFAIPQSIVMAYCHIKQLVEDCIEVMERSDLILVNINNITVSSWEPIQLRVLKPELSL